MGDRPYLAGPSARKTFFFFMALSLKVQTFVAGAV